MPELSQRTRPFTDSVIRRMTRLCAEHDAINLSQGFPDFDPPQAILQALEKSAGEDVHQYALTWGAKDFRQALARKQEKFMGIPIDPETEITVTCGSTEAMMCALMAVADPGDEVIVFSPFYENYGADSILCQATPIYVPLVPPHFNYDSQTLEKAFQRHPKALILCNPSNPCGKVFSRKELEEIVGLARKYDTFVITDEVYEHIVYPPYEHIYMASLPDMKERTISCSSLSKTYSITGWRLGYVLANPAITDRVKKVHDFLTVGAAAPLQRAALCGLEFEASYYQELQDLYLHKRDLFCRGLADIGLKHTIPQGAYYVLVDISEFGYESDEAFCQDLIEKIGVGAVPGSSFFEEDENRYIRFHFAKKDETLLAALERLAKIRALFPAAEADRKPLPQKEQKEQKEQERKADRFVSGQPVLAEAF